MLRPSALFQLHFPPPWPGLSRLSPGRGCRLTWHQLPAQQKDLLFPWGFSKHPESGSYWLRLGHESSFEQSPWPGQGAGPGLVTCPLAPGGRVYGLKRWDTDRECWVRRGKPDCCWWGSSRGPLPSLSPRVLPILPLLLPPISPALVCLAMPSP